MISALYSRLSNPGSNPYRENCVVSLGKTLYPHSAPLHPGLQMGAGEFKAWGNPAMD